MQNRSGACRSGNHLSPRVLLASSACDHIRPVDEPHGSVAVFDPCSRRLPEVQSRLEDLGAEPLGTTPERFDAHVKSEMASFERIIREAKIEPQ